jgi:hypothetical protein
MSKRNMAKRTFVLTHQYQISGHRIRHCLADPDSAFHVDSSGSGSMNFKCRSRKNVFVKNLAFYALITFVLQAFLIAGAGRAAAVSLAAG